MKPNNNHLALTTAVALGLLSVPTSATIIAEDDFDVYADGDLTGNNGGGIGWSGAYTDSGGSLAVAAGQIDDAGGPDQVGVNFRGLTTEINTTNYPGGEIWMGFDGRLVLAGSHGFGGISAFDGGSEKGLIGGVFGRDMFGIGGNDNGATGLNRTVVKFDLTTNAVSLWTGPVGGPVDISVAALQTGSININGTDNLRFALNSTDAGGSIQIDDFVMATTFTEVGGVSGVSGPVISVPGAVTLDSDGTPETLSILVTNDGDADLEVTGALPGGDHSSFFTVPPGQFTLTVAPGTSEDLTVGFNPGTFSGIIDAELLISSDGLPNKTVFFTGKVQNPLISVPGPNDFGPVANGAASHSFDILVDNLGFSEDLVISDASITDPLDIFTVDHDFNATIDIAAAGQGSVPISFDATGLDGGIYSAVLTIVNNDFNQSSLDVLVTVEVDLVASSTQHLVAWWPMESDSTDFSGNGHDGIDFGTPDYLVAGANAATGTGVSFDGTNTIDVTFDEALNPTSFTVTAWACPTAFPSGNNTYGSIVTSRRGSSPVLGYILYQSPDVGGNPGAPTEPSNWQLWTGNGGGWNVTQAPDASGDVTLNTWTHLAATYDHATQTQVLYVNGAAVQTSYGVTAFRNMVSALHIASGADDGTDHFFTGKLDDIAIFRVAHDASDISTIMNSGVGGFINPTDPIAITSFELTGGNIVITGTEGLVNGADYHIQFSTSLSGFTAVPGSGFVGGGAIPSVSISGPAMFIRLIEGTIP